MRHTKIVCTLGPASQSPEIVLALAESGMDVARLNFSHGTRADHGRRLGAVRAVARQTGRHLAVLQDLQGPKIRLGRFSGECVTLLEGRPFTLTTRAVQGTESRASTTYERLPRDVKPGDRIFLADGTLELEVEKTTASEVRTTVVRGGPIRSHQGINLPGVAVSAPSLTRKDREDLAFGLEVGVDLVALSFVRRASDVRALKRLLAGAPSDPWVTAKIEKPEALDNLAAILDEVDGVMVARGDLGVEIGLELVPQAQKAVIACSAHEEVLRRLAVVWGVAPLRVEPAYDVERAVTQALQAAGVAGLIRPGQTVLLTLSMLAGDSEVTNVIKLHKV